jgi:hypothetical protein
MQAFIIVQVIFISGFSMSFKLLLPGKVEWHNWHAWVTVFRMMLGDADIESFHAEQTNPSHGNIDLTSTVGDLLYILYCMFILIVMFNMLIAQMGDSFERVQEIERVAAARERVRVLAGIIRYNMTRPDQQHFPKWLHILTSREGHSFKPKGEEDWEGRLATIKMEVKNVKKSISKDVEILFEQQNKEFRKSHQEMKATLDELLNATRKEKSASP